MTVTRYAPHASLAPRNPKNSIQPPQFAAASRSKASPFQRILATALMVTAGTLTPIRTDIFQLQQAHADKLDEIIQQEASKKKALFKDLSESAIWKNTSVQKEPLKVVHFLVSIYRGVDETAYEGAGSNFYRMTKGIPGFTLWKDRAVIRDAFNQLDKMDVLSWNGRNIRLTSKGRAWLEESYPGLKHPHLKQIATHEGFLAALEEPLRIARLPEFKSLTEQFIVQKGSIELTVIDVLMHIFGKKNVSVRVLIDDLNLETSQENRLIDALGALRQGGYLEGLQLTDTGVRSFAQTYPELIKLLTLPASPPKSTWMEKVY